MERKNRLNRNSVLAGISQALPIIIGYIPVGFAYGVLAAKAGLSFFYTILMSTIVYAGSSQFIAVALLSAGGESLSIILTTFIVNLRHLLMSTALAPRLGGWKNWQKILFGFHLTDETFSIHSLNLQNGHPPIQHTFTINFTAQLSWIIGSGVGVFVGGGVLDIYRLGLDFALPAMFIALLVAQIKNRVYLWVAITSGIFSLLLYFLGAHQWNVVIAATLAAAIGLALKK
jgi:4-azaleucine resistance transporter AzlC